MTTTVTTTIRASGMGGDYTTPTAWEAGEQSAEGPDISAATGSDKIIEGSVYNDWPSGLDDNFSIDGWTTDATGYIKLTTASGNRHDGTPGTGFYIATTATYAIDNNESYTKIVGIECRNTSGIAFYTDQPGAEVTDCIGTSGSDRAFRCEDTTLATYFIKCLAVGGYRGFYVRGNLLNSIAAGCSDRGIQSGTSSSTLAKNTIAYGCGDNWRDTFDASSTNNASSNYSGDAPPGSSPYTSDVVSGDFANAANDDYHLSASSGLIGQGANLYSDFTTDIDGDTWPSSGAWDIGFDYYVSGAVALTIQDATHAHSAEAPTLTQVHVLNISEALHGHTADNVTLSAGITLLIDAATHAHQADSLTLTQVHSLLINAALHAHAADNVTLTQVHNLLVDSALHAHLADNVLVTTGYFLDIADGLHAHRADNVTLNQVHVLAVANSLHGHLADKVSLDVSVLVNDALHGHAAENVTLSSGYYLAIQDAVHAMSAEQVDIDQVHQLIISDGLHAHLAQNATISPAIIQTPDSRVILIAADDRIVIVAQEDRNFTIH